MDTGMRDGYRDEIQSWSILGLEPQEDPGGQMRLGVLSDSHDHVPNVRLAVELFQRLEVDGVVHGGDFVAPFAVKPLADLNVPVVAVFGNNDGERVGLAKTIEGFGGEVHPNLAATELGGRRIAAVHYPELAEPIARGDAFDLVIYGHTHEIEIRQEKALLLNPGEVGGWLTGRSTVATVDLTTMAVEIHDLVSSGS